MPNRIEQSYAILNKFKLPNGLYSASSQGDYSAMWLRDVFYILLPYLDKPCDTYEKGYHAILDIYRHYEGKLDYHIQNKPQHKHEYMHIRYDAETLREIPVEWNHKQDDVYGELLFGIAKGFEVGKKMFRDDKDHEITQKLVSYLGTLEYWQHPNASLWEEEDEVRSTSIGACVAGLEAIRDIVFVPQYLIDKGRAVLDELYPHESKLRQIDAGQLSLIYPYNLLDKDKAHTILFRVERALLRRNGVLRYIGDSYFSTREHDGRHLPLYHYYQSEAEWTMFLPWLSLCYMQLGDMSKANHYLDRTEKVMLPDGSLPELYYANSDTPNPNTPLLWSNSMYIQAAEMYDKLNKV